MIKNIKKVFVAGVLAFLVVNAVCFVYYKLPARKANNTGATDYKWKPNSFFCRATEGFGFGKINADGFNNSIEPIEIDVLMMGSSQLEGFNVPQKNIVSEQLNDISDLKCYNIGVSAHTLLDCFDNLDAALSTYNPKKYIVFETMSLSFYDSELLAVLNGGHIKDEAYDSGIIGIAQDVPFFRLVVSQYTNLRKTNGDKIYEEPPVTDKTLLEEIIKGVKAKCNLFDVLPIIIYHPTISVNENGIIDNTNDNNRESFVELCSENGIVYVDMAEDFAENYEKTKEFPHGFNNTTLGSGHLNSVGHRLMANRLDIVLSELEASNVHK